MSAHTWLFVPGDDPDKLEKAAGLAAEALIVDLEDAVPRDGKEKARALVADWLVRRERSGPAVWVRVNNEPVRLDDDIAAVVRPGVAGVIIPKVVDAAQAGLATQLVGNRYGVVAMIETAGAVLEAAAIAATPGVTTLMVGEYDLAAELGVDPSPDRRELAPARAMAVLACSAAGIDPPIAPVSANFRDIAAFRASTEALRREGHRGRAVIHPAQIGPANEVFTPSADEVARARGILDRYNAALAAGRGVGVDDDGKLIDEAIVRSARQTLAAVGAS